MSDGRVYFIQCGDDGPIKIGFSTNLRTRLAQLQTGQPQKLRVLRAMRGTKATEAFLHRQFAAHRLEGEWFAPHRDILRYIIDATLAPDETSRAPKLAPAPGAAPMTATQREEAMRVIREAREKLAARQPTRTPPTDTRSASALVMLADLMHVAAASGWVALADYQRVRARYGGGTHDELVRAGCVQRNDDGSVYVFSFDVVARAAQFANGDAP